MIVRQCTLAGLGLGDRYAVRRGKTFQRRRRFRIVHAAAGNDQRRLGVAQHRAASASSVASGRRPPHVPDTGGEEAFGIVERFGLDILTQRQRQGPHAAGSVSTETARGSAAMICSGRVIRSK